MASILLLDDPIARRTKPSQIVPFNHGSGLARDILFFYLFHPNEVKPDRANAIDVIAPDSAGVLPQSVVGLKRNQAVAASREASVEGYGYVVDGQRLTTLSSAVPHNIGTGDFTFITRAKTSLSIGGTRGLAGWGSFNPGFYTVRSGVVAYYDGGFILSDTALSQNTYATIAFTRKAGTVFFYVDGQPAGSGSKAASIPNSYFRFGDQGNGGDHGVAGMWAGMWTRALDPSEHRTIHHNMYVELFPDGDALPFFFTPSAGGVTKTPGVALLTLTGLAPTPAVTANVITQPGVSALTLTGLAPTFSIGAPDVVVATEKADLTLTGFAPAVGQNVLRTPDIAALSITGKAPATAVAGTTNVEPGVGDLLITGKAPVVTVTQNIAVSPGVGSLIITGKTPAPTIAGNVVVTPGVAALTLEGLAPSEQHTPTVPQSPDTADLLITGFAPAHSITTPLWVVQAQQSTPPWTVQPEASETWTVQ